MSPSGGATHLEWPTSGRSASVGTEIQMRTPFPAMQASTRLEDAGAGTCARPPALVLPFSRPHRLLPAAPSSLPQQRQSWPVGAQRTCLLAMGLAGRGASLQVSGSPRCVSRRDRSTWMEVSVHLPVGANRAASSAEGGVATAAALVPWGVMDWAEGDVDADAGGAAAVGVLGGLQCSHYKCRCNPLFA